VILKVSLLADASHVHIRWCMRRNKSLRVGPGM
jgi:hypothetical protein